MRICIPTDKGNGLESVPYGHFGSAPHFVLHDLETNETKVIANRNEHHEHGACHPITALAGETVDALLVGGIGRRAFARLNAAGIRIFQVKEGTARDNIEALQRGRLTEFTSETACHGRGHHG